MVITSNFAYTFILLLIVQFSLHSLAVDAAPLQLQCKNIYRNSQDIDIDLLNKPITDIDSFGKAMTSGMQLHAEQSDLFEVYRAMFLGDPNVSVDGKTLKSVTDILAKHPELEKPMFREYTINAVEKVYSSPDSLNKFVQSQITIAGQIRNNLFQVKANLGYWKKLLDYQDPPMSDQLSQIQKKLQTLQQGLGKAEPTAELVQLKEKYRTAKSNYDNSNTTRFRRYLNKIINNANQDLLADLTNEHSSYIQKATALFEMFRYLEEWMSKQGRNTQTLRQAMVDLVFTVGFGNQSTLELLKSANGLDKIQGLNQLWNECDSLAEQLGFVGHFVELKQKLRIEFPTGLSKNMDFVSSIQNLEKQVLAMPFSTRPTETIRVRSLSIQESPFRSCLGLDCSTRTYFDKALDPNYIYFTMTRFDHKSSGHATVVLGTATDAKTGTAIKVAFLDKLQNIPTQQIESFLTAVNKSLQDSGYRLAIPTDLGKNIAGHGGLSNMSGITDFVQLNIMPRLNNKLSAFTPHTHQYQFKNAYSRADQKLEVRLFVDGSLGSDIEIKSGNKNKSYNADKSLDKKQLISEFLRLKDSANEEDQIKFIKSSGIIPHLEKMNLYSRNEFETDLNKLLANKNHSIAVRKAALFELVMIAPKNNVDTLLFPLRNFSEEQKSAIYAEVQQWGKSSDPRKKKVAEVIQKKWFNFIQHYNSAQQMNLKTIMNFVDVNGTNGNNTAIHIATIYGQTEILKTLLKHSKLSSETLNAQNAHQFTAIHLAAENGNEEIMNILLSDHRISLEHINALSYDKSTVLHAVAENGHAEIIRILLKDSRLSADLISVKNQHEMTALFQAVRYGRIEVVKVLLNDHRMSVNTINATDKFGRTALKIAILEAKSSDIVKLLKAHGATE